MKTYDRTKLTGRHHRWFALLALAFAVVGCSESTTDTDVGDSVDADTDGSGKSTSALDAAFETTDEAGETAKDSSSKSCQLTPSGTCSPAPDPEAPGCSGCYEVRGQVFDTELGCLVQANAIVVACTTICTAGAGFECYARENGESVEVVLSPYTYFEATVFETDTGFVACDPDLRSEVLPAIPCATP